MAKKKGTAMAMTVAQLRGALSDYGDGDVVILAKDAEGNEFSPPYQPSPEIYLAKNDYSGELVDEGDDGVTACVLWPVN